MTSRHWVGVGVGVLVVAFVAWIPANTRWEPFEVDLPPKGEARVNPFYAAQQLAGQLGADTAWQHALGSAEPDAVLVASALYWTLIPSRRQAIEQWVDNGGRLVVDGLFLGTEEFDRWSGISQDLPGDQDDDDDDEEKDEKEETFKPTPRCRKWQDGRGSSYRTCGRWGYCR